MCRPGFPSVDHIFDGFKITHMQSQMEKKKKIGLNRGFKPDFV